MLQNTSSPKPNIRFLNPGELEELDAKINLAMEKQDFPELLKLGRVYPLPAKKLDGLKHRLGMNFLLESQLNLADAVQQYGEKWLES